ncbi:iron-hydroxamate ABC transporter substrate-binding protein [Paenibacillus sacheonensis]|uniref:ABC transporter substrate-binding protein n=1 Tax=Paenibacillus sacheonensis TaxID=742054 RepID=A0A7X4YT63_9BACL|nr:iron complex transport system substrate-binding protein [Paenibacillus sacheonensis]NBC72110.1 ABC transporter substrate-binding protein [Paenibacillus sacheonensis]
MRKKFISSALILVFTLIVSACGSNSNESDANPSASANAAADSNAGTANEAGTEMNSESNTEAGTNPGDSSGTITYQSENGPVVVPANPQRVVALAGFSGHLHTLGIPIVAVDEWSKQNPNFAVYLGDTPEVNDEDLEKIIELKPDLIIAAGDVKNDDKLKQIAPTITYTYGKVAYLDQFLEIGKLVNKEAEAQAWIDDFKKRAQAAGEKIRTKIGADATVTVMESYEKQLYVYGDHYTRGTEILYQEMKLNMPDKVKQQAQKEGYYALSTELLPQYAGDYIVFSKDLAQDNSFQETTMYKNLTAVKNKHVFEVDTNRAYFDDPVTLDYLLDFIVKSFLG